MISPVSASSLAAYSPSAALQTGTAARTRASATAAASQAELSQEQQQQIQQLEKTDKEVKAHEAAHLAAAGGLATGGATFKYDTGPDGKRYAVSGEVQISISEGRTPAETIARAEQVRRAALAPANPSAQDQNVAAQAAQMEQRARAELVAASFQTTGDTSKSKGSVIDTQA